MKSNRTEKYLLILILLSFYFLGEALAEDLTHKINTGRELFIKNRCVNCHTIGRGRFVGPDLSGVGSRYSRDEIEQWITNPQLIYRSKGKMPLNDGYPPMPPLEISGDDAEMISDYLLSYKAQTSVDTTGGIIKGEVINNNKKLGEAGVQLVLKAFMGDRETDERRAKTNEKGEFEFLNLPWDRGYTISLNYKGAEYVTDKMVFFPDEDEKVLELPVYETTESDTDIAIEEGHMIIQVSDGSISVADITVLNNKGEGIFIGENDIEGGRKETLSFSIPDGATNISFIHGLSQDMLVRTREGFSDTQGVWHGLKRVVYTYELPYESGRNEISKVVSYPTDSFLLLVSDSGDEVGVEGLLGGESVEVEGNNYLKWIGNNLNKGSNIIITIKKPFDSIIILKLVALAVFLSFICAGVIYSTIFKKNS